MYPLIPSAHCHWNEIKAAARTKRFCPFLAMPDSTILLCICPPPHPFSLATLDTRFSHHRVPFIYRVIIFQVRLPRLHLQPPTCYPYVYFIALVWVFHPGTRNGNAKSILPTHMDSIGIQVYSTNIELKNCSSGVF